MNVISDPSVYSTDNNQYRPTIFSDVCPGSLLDQVDEIQLQENLDEIDQLKSQNDALLKSITFYRQDWSSIVKLLREAFEAMIVLDNVLGECESTMAGVEPWMDGENSCVD